MPRRLAEALRRARGWLKSIAGATWRPIPALFVEVAAIVGASAVAYGVWQIYMPAGWIVGGVELIVFSVLWGIGLQRRS